MTTGLSGCNWSFTSVDVSPTQVEAGSDQTVNAPPPEKERLTRDELPQSGKEGTTWGGEQGSARASGVLSREGMESITEILSRSV
jgi:hypothetical protein